MASRAASASTSKKAKQELVRLLFGKKYRRKGPAAHSKLDPSIYSYADLRTAYLEQVHSIHPDKFLHQNEKIDHSVEIRDGSKEDLHEQFVELQEAWTKYESFARMMKNVSKGEKEDANFTMFGVGCSFADSAEERELRSEIMDQAGRGWFSSGSISASSGDSEGNTTATGDKNVSLSDDDMFVSTEELISPKNRPPEAALDIKSRSTRSLVSPALFRPGR